MVLTQTKPLISSGFLFVKFVESVCRADYYIEFHILDDVVHKINNAMSIKPARGFNRFFKNFRNYKK